MEKKYCVYRHISPNGKSYIGITQQKPQKRWGYGAGYQTQQKFYRAIKKYGWDKFTHVILENGLNKQEAELKEQYYIKEFNSIDHGYNVDRGGLDNGNPGTPIIQLSQSGDILNIFRNATEFSDIMQCSPTTISNWCAEKRMINGYYWVKLKHDDISEEIKEKYKKINKKYLDFDVQKRLKDAQKNIVNRRHKSELYSNKKINQYSLDGKYIQTFNSSKEAKEKTGITTIAYALKTNCRGGDYQWRYYQGDNGDIEPYNGIQRKIKQIDKDTGNIINIYDSMTEAEKDTGIKGNQIWKACNGEHKTSGGFIWRYYEDTDPITIPPKKTVLQIDKDTDEIIGEYNSLSEAEEKTGITNRRICKVCCGSCKTTGGYKWAYSVS